MRAAESAQAFTEAALTDAADQGDEEERNFIRKIWRQNPHFCHGKRHCEVDIAKDIRTLNHE